jgi:hypothetical protein
MMWNFSIYLILQAALGPRVHSASNRNEYQKQKKMFLGSRARSVRRAWNLTAICERSLDNVGSLTSHNPIGSTACLLFHFTLFEVFTAVTKKSAVFRLVLVTSCNSERVQCSLDLRPKSEPGKKASSVGGNPGLLLDPEDGDNMFLLNVGSPRTAWRYNPDE